MKTDFEKNYLIDYKKEGIVEKKGRFDYISWSHVQKIMRVDYPAMIWEPVWNEQSNSLVWGGFVRLLFKNLNEQSDQTIYYPILDHQNRPIEQKSINQFDINNAVMRGFAKGFAMITGHGLNLFTGEDLEMYETKKAINSLKEKKLSELEKTFFADFKGEELKSKKEMYQKYLEEHGEEKAKKLLSIRINEKAKKEGEKNE